MVAPRGISGEFVNTFVFAATGREEGWTGLAGLFVAIADFARVGSCSALLGSVPRYKSQSDGVGIPVGAGVCVREVAEEVDVGFVGADSGWESDFVPEAAARTCV
jgi:hypothetical protein